jgi:hypothetical protein
MARMSIARNSKAFIHSSRVCAEESQTLVKKAAEGKFNFLLSQVYTQYGFCKKRWKLGVSSVFRIYQHLLLFLNITYLDIHQEKS